MTAGTAAIDGGAALNARGGGSGGVNNDNAGDRNNNTVTTRTLTSSAASAAAAPQLPLRRHRRHSPLPPLPRYYHGLDHQVGSTFSVNYKYKLILDKVIIYFNKLSSLTNDIISIAFIVLPSVPTQLPSVAASRPC